MRQDLTDITVLIDRSGSMASCKNDAEGGLNSFIEEQKKLKGEAIFSLMEFDNEYTKVHVAKPIKEIGKYELHPRGSTALLDALGRSIVETGDRLRAMREQDRPGLVTFVVLTDGEENSSMEYTKAKIKEMIELQQNTYNWQFLFLGANQDAFAEASSMGIDQTGTMLYANNKTFNALQAASANVGRMRSASFNGQEVTNQYTQDEITASQ